MGGDNLDSRKATNLWNAYARKFPPISKSCRFVAEPAIRLESIGGLESAKDEIQTYACTLTHPDVYASWGTRRPTGLLLIGPPGSGKTLLAEALATLSETRFVAVNASRLMRQLVHTPGMLAPLLAGWEETFAEMPPSTVFFSELDSSLTRPLSPERPEIPPGIVLEVQLDLVDRTISFDTTLTVGSTSRPDTLPESLIDAGRFERFVEVVPVMPDDAVRALEIHANQAEKRAGRELFSGVNWKAVVGNEKEVPIGDWVRSLHGALRRKARSDAAGEAPNGVTTDDVRTEIDRFLRVRKRLPGAPGRYL